ncbi:MAG TPA: sensor histidine kinase [Polyangia bacterium]|nr:sensor histidine kinase [Polyangia bacterium]
MRLANFIRRHRDEIIAEWAAFTATMLSAAEDTSDPEFREHAAELLDAAAHDLDGSQTALEQRQKSMGFGTARRMAAVARTLAVRRMRAGFRLAQILAEYRALRASVVRLWRASTPRLSSTSLRDLTRFHEAVDEAWTESVTSYIAQLDQYRDQFLAVLGHDLRNPLHAVALSAASLARPKESSERQAVAVRRILNASERMSRMVSDLLDLTRTRLGNGIPVVKRPTSLEAACNQVVDELQAAHPGRRVILDYRGDLSGTWDRDRLAQIISNLVANALQHGNAAEPVTVRAVSNGSAAILTVHNHGKPIPPASLKRLFEPMVRLSDGQDFGQSASLGMGLFIVRELVKAHGGTVAVTSTPEDGTTFRVTLPRHGRNQRKPPRSVKPRRHGLPAIDARLGRPSVKTA